MLTPSAGYRSDSNGYPVDAHAIGWISIRLTYKHLCYVSALSRYWADASNLDKDFIWIQCTCIRVSLNVNSDRYSSERRLDISQLATLLSSMSIQYLENTTSVGSLWIRRRPEQLTNANIPKYPCGSFSRFLDLAFFHLRGVGERCTALISLEHHNTVHVYKILLWEFITQERTISMYFAPIYLLSQ